VEQVFLGRPIGALGTVPGSLSVCVKILFFLGGGEGRSAGVGVGGVGFVPEAFDNPPRAPKRTS